MKKMLAVIMLALGAFIIFMFTLILLIDIPDPDSGLTLAHLWIMLFFFFVPGALLLFYGRKLWKGQKKSNAPPSTTSSNSRNTHSAQTREGTDTTVQDGEAATTSTARKPVTVGCPGCGYKVTVYPNRVTKCEYCATVVPFEET